jgi:hypothetical protein
VHLTFSACHDHTGLSHDLSSVLPGCPVLVHLLGDLVCRPAVAEPPSATGTWLAADSLDSHLGGARTLILPDRTGPATRESA